MFPRNVNRAARPRLDLVCRDVGIIGKALHAKTWQQRRTSQRHSEAKKSVKRMELLLMIDLVSGFNPSEKY
jgi:hypothetical protein